MVQVAFVVTRTRGILRRCAPQDDRGEQASQDDRGENAPRNDRFFVILSGTTWNEESRACAVQQHPSRVATPLPAVRATRAGRARNARPYGVAAIPLHIATASGRKPQSGTTPLRAKRVLKGKWVIDKREKTAGCLPLARSAAARAAFPPAMRGQFRNAFQGDTPPHRAGAVPYKDLSVSA